MADTAETIADEPSTDAPSTARAQVEVKTHADKYSTKDLLVDVSIFRHGEKPMFARAGGGEAVSGGASAASRRAMSHRRIPPIRGRGSPNEPRVAEQIKAQVAAIRLLSTAPSSQPSQPWVTGYPYYFLIEAEGCSPAIVKGCTAPPRSGWPASLKVSIHEKLAAVCGVSAGAQINITPVPRSMWHLYELDHVEMTVLDAFVSRSDMWGAMHNLRHSTFYVGKKVLVSGYGRLGHSAVTIKAMLPKQQMPPSGSGGGAGAAAAGAAAAAATASASATGGGASGGGPAVCLSGLVSDATKFTVRSLSARMIMLFQISRELFNYGTEEEGDIYFSRAVDTLVRDLVAKWRAAGCNHTVTLVLYASLEATGDAVRDFIRPVWQGSGSSDWGKVPQLLKCAVHAMIRDMRATTPIHPASHLGREGAKLSTARNGNSLEAINLALNSLARHHVDRALNRTGLTVIIVTAGTGLIRTTRELSRLTSQRILDTGIGCDMICLGRPPLHVSPLFEYPSGSGSSAFEYERPTWMNVRFYCKDPASVYMTECMLMTYGAAKKLFLEASMFTPQCRANRWRGGFDPAGAGVPGAAMGGFVPIDTSHLGQQGSPPAEAGRVLPSDHQAQDRSAFKVTGTAIRWAGRGHDGCPVSPPAQRGGGSGIPHHHGVNTHAHSYTQTHSNALREGTPGAKRDSTFAGCPWHSRTDSGTLSVSLAASQSDIGALPRKPQGYAWSPQSPNYGVSALPYGSKRPSPSKLSGLPDALLHQQCKQHSAQHTRGSGMVGPQPLLISPFDTSGWRVLDCTNPQLIHHRMHSSLDPFEEANCARWSHVFPQEASEATGTHGPYSGAWKFIVEPALLPLTSPYYPDSDHIQGFEIHHSTKTPSSQGVVPVPPGPEGMTTFLHETIVQRLHQGYQFIPPIFNKTYRLSLGHQFHEISADSWNHTFQQWVHQEYRARQQRRDADSMPQLVRPPSLTRSPQVPPSIPPSIPASGVSGTRLSVDTLNDAKAVGCGGGGGGGSGGDEELPSPALEFTYHLHNPFSRGWDFRRMWFRNESGNVYVNWSGLDQLLSGTQDEADLENKRRLIDPLFQARRVKYAIVPEVGGEGFKSENVSRWVDQICYGSEFNLRTKDRLGSFSFRHDDLSVEFDIAALIESAPPPGNGSFPAGNLPEERTVQEGVIELVMEDAESRKGVRLPTPDQDEATYQAEVPSATPPVNACPSPFTPARSPWFVLGLSQEAHPRCYMTFSVTWLACPGCKISEFIDLCRRRMLQTMGQGYNLVQIPCTPFSMGGGTQNSESRSNPFNPYIFMAVANEQVLRLVIVELMERHGYFPSSCHVGYDCALLHASGEAMVCVPSHETWQHGIGLYFVMNSLASTTAIYLDTMRYDVLRDVVDSFNTAGEVVEDLVGAAVGETVSDITLT